MIKKVYFQNTYDTPGKVAVRVKLVLQYDKKGNIYMLSIFRSNTLTTLDI